MKFVWAFSRRLYQSGKSETPIDDEFNLPVYLGAIILTLYITSGAIVYTCWEDWDYFEAFYFVFVSMSTIGFGDFVPEHPIYMMCTILYLVFGLALTSMFINIVQMKLKNKFKGASLKLGTLIGLNMEKDENSSVLCSKSSLNEPPPIPLRTENVPEVKEVKRRKKMASKRT